MENLSSSRADGTSEYGSDFTPDEEEILNGLLQDSPILEVTDNPITDRELQLEDTEQEEGPFGVRLPLRSQHASFPSGQAFKSQVANEQPSVQLNNRARLSTHVESDSDHAERESSASIEAPLSPTPEVPDLRSPLARFRTKPMKALSVTDLISPSWCELQYWYTLTKHGRKRRTPAMRQGSKVHKRLEDEVHVTVQVDITSKEDKMGLRIWNTIQGLRTLRDTGMTRELIIWGLLDNQVVNGVIDELNYTCPDRELEASAEEQKSGTSKKTASCAPDQATITEYLSHGSSLESAEDGFANALRSTPLQSESTRLRSRIYISDVKTRGVRSLPKGASFRPTLMQLSLYHRLLANLATGNVDPHLLLQRYDLDASRPFTDSFIAQIGNLNQGEESIKVNDSSPQDSVPTSSQDSLTTLLIHNSLNALWGFMMEEFKTTFPLGAKSLGSVLKAEYRDSSTGDIMGSKTILYDHEMLEKYLNDGMTWWRGERSARGVSVEEAYKCGSCDFAEGCEWRANKIDDHVKTMRSRSQV